MFHDQQNVLEGTEDNKVEQYKTATTWPKRTITGNDKRTEHSHKVNKTSYTYVQHAIDLVVVSVATPWAGSVAAAAIVATGGKGNWRVGWVLPPKGTGAYSAGPVAPSSGTAAAFEGSLQGG